MAFWKLGTNWGTNAPSFYNMISRRNIVITDKGSYQIGDFVLVTQGFEVCAIAKVLENSISVTQDPDLQSDLEAHGIPYEDFIDFAKVEWYELDADDVFEYRLQRGISRVADTNTIQQALNLYSKYTE